MLYVSVVAVSVGICTTHYYTLRDETTVNLTRLFLVFVLHQQTLINNHWKKRVREVMWLVTVFCCVYRVVSLTGGVMACSDGEYSVTVNFVVAMLSYSKSDIM